MSPTLVVSSELADWRHSIRPHARLCKRRLAVSVRVFSPMAAVGPRNLCLDQRPDRNEAALLPIHAQTPLTSTSAKIYVLPVYVASIALWSVGRSIPARQLCITLRGLLSSSKSGFEYRVSRREV